MKKNTAYFLIIGNGGREHALARTLAHKNHIYCWPGSDSIDRFATRPPAKNLTELIDWTATTDIDICLVGDEQYLAQSISDSMTSIGIKCWSPNQAASRIETDKCFAKKFMRRHNIPHPNGHHAKNLHQAQQKISDYQKANKKFVLKYPGLAAGKGVCLAEKNQDIEKFLLTVFHEKKWGDAGLIIEDKLHGDEISIFAAVNNTDYQLLPPARDYKALQTTAGKINTGGMGAVTGNSILSQKQLAEIREKIIQPTLNGLVAEGIDYHGFLYFGLMLTTDGAQVLEYNCRLGDPETQAILALIDGDLGAWLLSAAAGKTPPIDNLKISDDFAISVVLATKNYPFENSVGQKINGLENKKNLIIDHAGSKNSAGTWRTNGGRVLTITARATSLATAREQCYAAIHDGLGFTDMIYHPDIGADFF